MLPKKASTKFDVSPRFRAASDGIASLDVSSNKITLRPSLHGFELIVKVNAHYGADELTDNKAPLWELENNCLDIQAPEQNGYAGDDTEEYEMKTNLKASGPNITGTLTYAAVLPGSYIFEDGGCADGDGEARLGWVTTANLGSAYGYDQGNELAVYAERRSATDIVILYGLLGEQREGSEARATSSCISNDGGYNVIEPKTWHPVSSRIDRYVAGVFLAPNDERQWYEFGSLTFPLLPSRSRGYGYEFYYSCGEDNNPVPLN